MNNFYKVSAQMREDTFASVDYIFEEEIACYTGKKQKNPLINRQVFAVELLALSVLYHNYAENIPKVSSLMHLILKSLYRTRKIHPLIKIINNKIRAMLMNRYLVGTPEFSVTNPVMKMKNLYRWLDSSGEFDQECRQIKKYIRRFSRSKLTAQKDFLEKMIRLNTLFLKISKPVRETCMKEYDQFATDYPETHKGKEDYILLKRHHNDYLLNLIGSEMLNTAFLKEWQKKKDNYILLPSCMSKKGEAKCPAKKMKYEAVCIGCMKNCQVNQISKLAEKYEFKTRLISHSTGFSNWFKQKKITSEIAIIGIACAMNLFTGGWEAMNAKVPAQCVFLNYPGCQKHWHPKGVVTDINLDRLETIMKQRGNL